MAQLRPVQGRRATSRRSSAGAARPHRSRRDPRRASEALGTAATILDESIAQPRPRYFAFIGSSGLEIGVLGDALASCFDVNLARYAAAATEVERQALDWVGEFVGYPGASGTFTSGGTVSNLTALAAARERALPGSPGRRHRRAAADRVLVGGRPLLDQASRRGSGLRVGCPAPSAGRCESQAQAGDPRVGDRRDIDAGFNPVAVVAAAGTTLSGAIDPLAAVADVCAERAVWLHVDGAYGLPAASVPEFADRFDGVERADSISIDAHKWLYLPKACGIVLVRDSSALAAAFAHEESYMPHDHGELHAVDMTLEYSRPFRALKLWLAFRVHGARAIRDAIRRNLRAGRAARGRDPSSRRSRVADGAPALDRALPTDRLVRSRTGTPTTRGSPRRSRPMGGSTSPRQRWTARSGSAPASSTTAPRTTTFGRSSRSPAS